jgi:carboxymethylenebutenolidase
MTEDIRRTAIALYDRFTHEGMDLRLLLRRMVAVAGSVAAA